ncbi:MAG: hypothetical protein GY753_11975 [Gammaproteobacteria bacterium]|nr:hypothetical protein [Gammaproteobacteria bacterium]
MYKHKLIFADQAFELDMDIPVNTSATASTALRAAGAAGRLAITAIANDAAVALADTKKFTISILTSTTEGGSYAAPEHAPSMVRTMSAAYDPDVGEVIASLLIPVGYLDPETDKWIKAVITTDDAAAAGDIDVFLEYLAN